MGQSQSTVRSKPARQRSIRGFGRRSKLNQSNLSHTFSVPPSEEYPELMNINTATEEQLMTLPSVPRPLAREIVRHRQMIGRFKRVDDLALVSGIGAEKLEFLRPEICTGTKRQVSRASSCTQSLDSIKFVPETKERLCSVNSSSVFQLQCVPGLNQELAANIVDHRIKKGPFKSLDDLIKVRGMDIIRLSTVKPHLSLELRKCESVQNLTNGHLNGYSGSISKSLNGVIHTTVTSTPRSPHRKSLSYPTKFPVTLPNGFASAPVNDILDLLSAYSHRPIVEEVFTYERNGIKCCRMATWNLHQLNVDKIMNPGVREVVCRTILENKLSLIAIQDVLDEAALRITVDELNRPTLRRVKEWKSNSSKWDYVVSKTGSKHLGFIFDTTYKGINIEDVDIDQLCTYRTSEARAVKRLAYEIVAITSDKLTAAIQAFLICDRPYLAINIGCKSSLDEPDTTRLRRIVQLAKDTTIPVVYIGEFYTWDNIASMKSCDPLLTEETSTTVDTSTTGKSCILSPDTEKNQFNGHTGVVRTGLSHLAIPRGWSWGGPVSPHCLVWAEFNLHHWVNCATFKGHQVSSYQEDCVYIGA